MALEPMSTLRRPYASGAPCENARKRFNGIEGQTSMDNTSTETSSHGPSRALCMLFTGSLGLIVLRFLAHALTHGGV